MTPPTLDLDTTVTRDRPVTHADGAIQVEQDESDESLVTLSFGGAWGTTYADLTPADARAIATALEHAAAQAAATTEGPADE
mgnify:CR=1 FL=1